MTVLEEFKEQIVDRLPDVDSYKSDNGLICVIIDDRGLKDTHRAMKSVKAIMPDANIVHYKDPINSIQDYDLLLTSEEFWSRFDSEFILIFQPDSLMLNPINRDCFLYHYVGAPWDFSRAKKHRTWVGNGGFSLRDVNESLFVVRSMPYSPKTEHHEDTYFSNRVLSIAPFEIAKQFSVEWHYYPHPTGIHDIESHLSQNLVKNILYGSDLYKIAKQPVNIFSLVTPKGFISEHLRLIGQGYSGRDAFDILNESYYDHYGVYKYSDYESFKAAKSYQQNKFK